MTAPMSVDVQAIDITGSEEILDLAEEVRRSGVSRLLKRGEQELALITPVTKPAPARSRRPARSDEPDPLLSIIGLGASAEPTNIARDELELLAEAYDPARQ